MFAITRISLYSDRQLRVAMTSCATLALLTLLSSPLIAVAEAPPQLETRKPLPFKPDDIFKVLTSAVTLPPTTQELAISFLNSTLPKLLSNDERLAQQLGFKDRMKDQLIFERVFPLMIIRRADVLEAVEEIKQPMVLTANTDKKQPMDLINNTDNWKLDNETLIPRRFILLLKIKHGTEESGLESSSSVTLELSQTGDWRIYQVGAPKLSRAMSLHGTPETTFLLWLPDLNRHYLGQMITTDESRNPKIVLTALFDDRLIRAKNNPNQIRKAGDTFDASSEDFFKRMRDLSQDLDLPKKLRRSTDAGGQPKTAQ